MTRILRRTILVGFAALAAAHAATAATISSKSPYRPTASAAAAARLAAPGQEGLDFDAAALSTLQQKTTRVLEITSFPVSPGVTGKLRLHRFEVAAPGARITLQGADGETYLPLPEIAHYSGIVEGEPDSSVYLAATSDGVVAWIHSSAGHSYVGPDESGTAFVVRDSASPLNAAATNQPWKCDTENMPAALSSPALSSVPAPTLPDVTYKQASVRVETDNQLYQHFGSNATTLATYVMTLFGATNVIYTRDLSLYLVVSEIHVWTVADPYTATDTLNQLYQFGTWWHANRPIASNPRTYVHYLSGHPVAGGIAWVGVLCSADFQATSTQWGGGYSLTQVNGSLPLSMWDQDSSAHEMGHNVGSAHTHCYSPPIDHCYNQEQGCYAGPAQNPGLGNGTIMSYCHLLGWQYMSLVFHPRCISEQMMPGINGASCLTLPVPFADVLPSDPFLPYITTVYNDGITGGCGTDPLVYCPTAPVTRAQMAAFLLKAIHGSAYAPPACAGLFTDVPCSNAFAPWIEELSAEGITAGCGDGTTFCPNDSVTRQQMAAFLLKAEHGSGYTPPACTSNPFADVACPSTFANWIQQLVAESVTGGCGSGAYCPGTPVTRGQMAVFLVKTFGL